MEHSGGEFVFAPGGGIWLCLLQEDQANSDCVSFRRTQMMFAPEGDGGGICIFSRRMVIFVFIPRGGSSDGVGVCSRRR